MLVGVNELRGLIVNVKKEGLCPNKTWVEILDNLPCVFIVADLAECEKIKSILGREIKCLAISSLQFGNLNRITIDALDLLHMEPFEVAYVTAKIGDFRNFQFQLVRF